MTTRGRKTDHSSVDNIMKIQRERLQLAHNCIQSVYYVHAVLQFNWTELILALFDPFITVSGAYYASDAVIVVNDPRSIWQFLSFKKTVHTAREIVRFLECKNHRINLQSRGPRSQRSEAADDMHAIVQYCRSLTNGSINSTRVMQLASVTLTKDDIFSS